MGEAILVTGGAGFIGSCFVRQWLREEPGLVVVLDKLTYAGHLANLREVQENRRLVFQQGDIQDKELVRHLLQHYRPWAVAHLAAETHVDRSIDGPASFVMTNVVGTCMLLEAVLEYWEQLDVAQQQAFRFLHISTDEVYGSLGPEGVFTEQSPYAPRSPYAASKAAADHFVRAYHYTYGLPVVITNCSNNYGPYQYPEKLIPLMILNALDRKPLPVYGTGENVRDWIHVEDHCRGLRLALRQGRVGEAYHFAGGNEIRNVDLVRWICRLVDALPESRGQPPCQTLVTFVTDRPGHDFRYAMDASKARKELGWQPQIDFAEGLKQTVQWYARHRDWARDVLAGRYDRQRLGLRGTRR